MPITWGCDTCKALIVKAAHGRVCPVCNIQNFYCLDIDSQEFKRFKRAGVEMTICQVVEQRGYEYSYPTELKRYGYLTRAMIEHISMFEEDQRRGEWDKHMTLKEFVSAWYSKRVR